SDSTHVLINDQVTLILEGVNYNNVNLELTFSERTANNGALIFDDGDDNSDNHNDGENTPDPQGQETTDIQITGDESDDSLLGAAGDDQLFGNAGNDFLAGNGGNDRLFGGDGEDILSGGDGEDFLRGGAGDDGLVGGAGQDHLKGDSGDDAIASLGGVDETLFKEYLSFIKNNPSATSAQLETAQEGVFNLDKADQESDFIEGGKGDDQFLLGGNDVVKGEEGNDTYTVGDWIEPGNPVIIQDYEDGEHIDFSIPYDTSEPSLTYRYDEASDSTHVLINDQVTLILEGANYNNVGLDFIFFERGANGTT
ncbi:MAG: calcium-binding protein, partial [Flavobacteriales bacterium]